MPKSKNFLLNSKIGLGPVEAKESVLVKSLPRRSIRARNRFEATFLVIWRGDFGH